MYAFRSSFLILLSSSIAFSSLFLFTGCKDDEIIEVVEILAFRDTRDNELYSLTNIGDQTWMTENLRFDPPGETTWCYDDLESNCEVMGRLYHWGTALNVCPDGWHLPSDGEWTVLTDFLGGESIAGRKMKSTGLEYWQAPNEGATNESGFNGLPAGLRTSAGVYSFYGATAYWWSSTGTGPTGALNRRLFYAFDDLYSNDYFIETGQSVRCVKD